MLDLSLMNSNQILAEWSPIAIWNGVWPYLIMLLGFTAIIFVHELGHFAVAKWCGVRVERFAIGFGRELFGFTRGETRYSFNILPLGGYVKMLGQEDFDDKAEELKFKDDPRSFVNKPVGQRMAVVSAGVIMNVLFAGFLFMIIFMIGMDAVTPRVGFIEPDSPAAKAGLIPGDLIRKVNGEKVLEFDEVNAAIFLSKLHEPVEFHVERGGEIIPPILVQPEYRHPDNTRQPQRQIIGIAPAVTREIIALGPDIDPTKPDSPRVGDKLLEVEGVKITDENVTGLVDMLGYARGPVVVERIDSKRPDAPPQNVNVRIPPQLAIYPGDPLDAESVSVLGLTPLSRFGLVDPRGRAAVAGIEVGDTVLMWDDIPYPSSSDIAISIRDNPERDIAFRLLKPDGRKPMGAVRPKKHKRGQATIQAICKQIEGAASESDAPQCRIDSVRRNGRAAKAGIESGDVILQIESIKHPSVVAVNRKIRENADMAVSIRVRKPSGAVFETTVTPQAPGSIDATHTLVAENVLVVGEVLAVMNGRPSPAAEAGVPTGARINSVNGEKVSTWRDLISALQKNAGASVQLAYIDSSRAEHVVPFRVPHCLRTLLGIGPEGRILTINERETVSTKTARGTEDVTVRYHEGTRAILRELIGQKAVPVTYRANVLSPIETKMIDVTEEIVDPWLGRVAFMANARMGDETRLLKGENALDAVAIGVHKTYYFLVQVYQVLHRMIFSRSVSVDAMSGPLGIITVGGQLAEASTVRFLFFLAMLSANLAVINFLPLPIVDGGLMVFLLIEKIKGSPVSLKVQVATQMIGIFLIISCFLYVTYNDAVRLWG